MDMLPDQALQEILSRLPIRSVMQCRLVCRRWRDLTRGLHFTRNHTAKSLAAKPGIMVSKLASNRNGLSRDSEIFFMDRRITAPIPTFFPVQLSIPDITKFNLLTSCNGLLLLISCNDNSTIFVCNPFIQKFIALPDHEYPNGEHVSTYIDFGFCPKTESYKVVEIYIWCVDDENLDSQYREEKYVHKLGENSWTRIESEVPIITRIFGLASNINGALHWADRCCGASLIVFNLEHNVFKEMFGPLPGGGGTDTGTFANGIIENCLSIINIYDDIADVWIMKEYWVSWEKYFVINFTFELGKDVEFEVFNYEVEGSEFLVFHNDEVLTYNVEENEFKTVVSLQDWCKMVPHHDTFVSPLD